MMYMEKLRTLDSLGELKGAINAIPAGVDSDFIDDIRDISGYNSPSNDPELCIEFQDITDRAEALKRIIIKSGVRKEILNELIDLVSEDNFLECRAAFREGLRNGFRLAEFLCDKNSSI